MATAWWGPAHALQVLPTEAEPQKEASRVDPIALGDYSRDSWQARHLDADASAETTQRGASGSDSASGSPLYEPEVFVTLFAALAAAGFVVRRRGPG